MTPQSPQDLPAALAVPVHLQARNQEYNLDLSGRVTHLDEKGLIVTFPVEIPNRTVLFTNIGLPTINAVVRGLISIRSQSEAGELGGFRTVADFVDLNEDERHKIARMLGGAAEDITPMSAPGESPSQTASHTGGFVRAPVSPASTLPPRKKNALRKLLQPRFELHVTFESIIWMVLGIIFYSIVVLGIVAIFPQGRAYELTVLGKIGHTITHNWPWVKQIFGS